MTPGATGASDRAGAPEVSAAHPARVLVTGAAGFVGSHLADELLARGHHVTGVDCYTSMYPYHRKVANTARLRDHPRCVMVNADLRTCELEPLLTDADVVFHLAGEPGVRSSWADTFLHHDEYNIRVTQRLLEGLRRIPVRRLVFASSSSVYGNSPLPISRENDPTVPHSPYGVSKLAAEHLVRLYAANFGIHTVVLRYFTLYGPRQRPDMALHRLIEAALNGQPFPVFGAGGQLRDFTYVGDAVAATVAAGFRPLPPGTVLNVAGGSACRLLDLVPLVGAQTGCEVRLDPQAAQPGDVAKTRADTSRAAALLDWRPATALTDGVAAQVAWHLELRGVERVMTDGLSAVGASRSRPPAHGLPGSGKPEDGGGPRQGDRQLGLLEGAHPRHGGKWR